MLPEGASQQASGDEHTKPHAFLASAVDVTNVTRSEEPTVEPSGSERSGRSFGPLRKSAQLPRSHAGILKENLPAARQQADRAITPEAIDDAQPEESPSGTSHNISDNQSRSPNPDQSEDEERGRKRSVETSKTTPMDPDAPTVTVTPPSKNRTTSKTFIIKPKDHEEKEGSNDRERSPLAQDVEALEEIRTAQRLGIATSTVATPESHRIIRTLVRGNYGNLQDEVTRYEVRPRTYLQAANLKPESAYATGFTIGTVLRDGDTLILIFAIDKDAETGRPGDGIAEGDGARLMRETTAEMDEMTRAATRKPSLLAGMKKLLPSSRKSSVAADVRVPGKQQDRMHALEKLSELSIGFLRKTKLQVRVVIEVVHCMNSRYLLTEAIDVLKPTLVIVGSRGRSVMKGAIAGSFSRYLIMKSSIPVMTARMKTSSRKVKADRTKIRLTNNLEPSRRLEEARIDELGPTFDRSPELGNDADEDE